MSKRTAEIIQQEYTQLAAKLGHALVQIKNLENEVPRIHDAVQALMLEQAALNAELASEAQKKEEAL
jgi:hypothetical protein